MQRTYSVSINNGVLNINVNGHNYQGGSPFKNGEDGTSQITFDIDFWKKCFIGDSVKDGCPLAILDGFLTPDYIGADKKNRISGEAIKKLSSDMTKNLEASKSNFKAEILRLKNYKTTNNPELRTRFSTAFPEGREILTNKDCGLDPAVFLPADRCKKSCNIASNIIDPHTSRDADCDYMFPQALDTLVLTDSVFRYLQYPYRDVNSTYILTARTTQGKTFYPMSFMVDGVDLLQDIPKYFAGNRQKNESFSRSSNPQEKKNNQILCVAKYSGDTLQSFIQRIYELIYNNGLLPQQKKTYVISTCDSIVALRSYALNGSYIEVCDDNEQEKVTQAYVWRPEMANIDTLIQIFNAEKARILHGYTDFIALVTQICGEANHIICIPGTNRIYRFHLAFYNNIITDVQQIYNQINLLQVSAANNIETIATRLRLMRTFEVDDFLKININKANYYMMSMSTKYMKAKYTDLFTDNVTLRPVGQPVGQPVWLITPPVWSINKLTSHKFFEFAARNYNVQVNVAGGSSIHGGHGTEFDYTSILSVKGHFFEEKTLNEKLDKQFLKDFKIEFNQIYIIIIPIKQFFLNIPDEYNHETDFFFNCLFDVIGSFSILELNEPTYHFYSNKGISWLIRRFFVNYLTDMESYFDEIMTLTIDPQSIETISRLKQDYSNTKSKIQAIATQRIQILIRQEKIYISEKRKAEKKKERQTEYEISRLKRRELEEIDVGNTSLSRSKSPDKKNNPRRGRSRGRSRSSSRSKSPDKKNNPRRERSRSRGREEYYDRAAREKNNYNRGRSRERSRGQGPSRGRSRGRSGGSKTRKIRR